MTTLPRDPKAPTGRSAPIKVAIVEDNLDVCDGLAFLIGEAPNFECVAKCATAEEALLLLPERNPDVILMDVELPGMSGIDCIRRLKVQLPEAQIMMLTIFDDPERIFRSLAAGASGYLIKKTPPKKLLQSIRELHAGGSPMSSQIARHVIEAFRKTTIASGSLTARENEILDYVMRGHSYKEIAQVLGISVETVRTHVRKIYNKLHVKSRLEVIDRFFPRARNS